MNKLENLFGWLGALVVVISYGLVSSGVIAATSFSYQVSNLMGAVSLMFVAVMKKAPQPAVVNLIWIIIAIGSLLPFL